MNEKERLQLNKMIKINNVEDQTNQIRTLKHSSILEKEIKELLILKEKYREQPEVLLNESIINCNFLYNNYTDIYNRVKKDEINIDLLFHFIHVLSQIEEGIIDQHDGSFMVGKLLKEIYIDRQSEWLMPDDVIDYEDGYSLDALELENEMLYIKCVHNSSGKLHPTQKPVELMEFLIKTYTNEGDFVLDNAIGSGTTCLASKINNRKFIGIENDEKFYKISYNRCGL